MFGCSSITNLKYWASSEQIISKTLQLLSDLSVGYSSVRKLVKLEAVQFMLNNHTVSIMWACCCCPVSTLSFLMPHREYAQLWVHPSRLLFSWLAWQSWLTPGMLIFMFYLQNEHFPFLGVTNSTHQLSDMRCRTTFYTALGRLLMVELGEDEERFERFMMPLTGGWKKIMTSNVQQRDLQSLWQGKIAPGKKKQTNSSESAN